MTDLNTWNQYAAEEVNLSELDQLVKAFREQREIYERADEIKKAEYLKLKEKEGVLLRILQSAKKSQYLVDGIGLISVVNKYVIQVPDTIEDLRALYDYVSKKHGADYADSIFKVHSRTLTSFYNTEKEASPDAAFAMPGVQPPTLEQSLRLTKK